MTQSKVQEANFQYNVHGLIASVILKSLFSKLIKVYGLKKVIIKVYVASEFRVIMLMSVTSLFEKGQASNRTVDMNPLTAKIIRKCIS